MLKKETRVEQDSYARDLILPTTDIIYKQRSSLMNNEEEGLTILDASRSSNVRGLGVVDESAAAFEWRLKQRHRKFADVLLLRLSHNGGSLRLAKTILDASRSSNVRDLGSVDESAAAFEKRSKRLNLETDS
ncbi:hypothetical protein HID58_004360 [Brassica napus]|uniref:Uncharacterized protein n=1 Tax=Brassica napus TaxID=3708 RepID=A0ABQ8E5K5_BRANA|nr:hypothetical protein HID58_004360 [Brassica napus]